MKLVAYLRVSGLSQAYEGFGLETQRDNIKEWAAVNGHKIVATKEDAGISGTVEGLSRPGFSAAVEMIKAGSAQGFIAYDMTRIARALLTQEVALGVLWDAGAAILWVANGAVDQNVDSDDGTRTFVRHIMGALAEYQRTNLVTKAREGKTRAKAAGQHTDGLAPFGWRVENKFLTEDQPQQATLNMIYRLREDKRSWKWIADYLNDQNYPTAGNGKWYEASVYRVVKRAREMRT